MAAGTLWLFGRELGETGNLLRAQTAAVTTMVLFQVFHVGNSRSERRSLLRLSPWSNPFLFVATAAALLVHVAALHWAPTQLVLRVEALDWATWVRMGLVAGTIILAIELHKWTRPPR
jgi:Ca2+-transporting ATPase